MNEIQLFLFKDNGVRVFVNENGEPEFCAADVTAVLGYSNGRKAIADHCKSRGVTKRDIPSTSGNQQYTFIDEGNLYRLVLKSEKPEAEPFEAWVCDEVLPTIRKHGTYSVNQFQIPQTFAEALQLSADQAKQLEERDRELKVLAPKALFADSVSTSSSCILIA